MHTQKMYQVMIRIKKNDNVDGKRVHKLILEALKEGKISGATVWTGVGGYGKRGKSDVQIEGITINMPMLIEVVEEIVKLEKVLPKIKEIVDDNGLVTIHEVGML